MRLGRYTLFASTLLAASSACACPIPGDSLFAHGFENGSGVFRYVLAAAPNNSGNGSFAQPWKTIQYAADHLAAGDTACVRAGTYNEIVAPTHYGSAAAGPVTVDLTLSGPQNTGEGSDTFLGIENLIGSHFADTLIGNGSNRTLFAFTHGRGVFRATLAPLGAPAIFANGYE